MKAELAHRYGTPAYIYDLAAVRRAHRDLVAALPPGSVLHYSLKANPHPRLVRELVDAGCHVEVSSVGEIYAALEAGVEAGHVQLTGPGKTDETIAYAYARGVRRFSVDSPLDLARVGAHATRLGVQAECLLRVNIDESTAGHGLVMTGVASPFGADASWVADRPELFRGVPAAPVTGLHLYCGTNLVDEDALIRQFDGSVRLAARLRALLPAVSEVNLGGGFGSPYARDGHRSRLSGLRDRLVALLDAHLPGWAAGSPQVSFESGRYLVGDSGSLVCGVVDVKRSKGRTFVVLDTGVHHLGGMSGLRRLPPLLPSIRPLDDPDSIRETVDCVVVGPLCTPLDTLAHNVALADPRPGDLLHIPNVGAYGLTASLIAFLGHPAAVEIVVDGDAVVDVSRLFLTR